MARERLAQRRVDLRARDDGLARLVAHDEVEEARAHAALVRQVGVQVRQRQQRLRRNRPVTHHDRQLTAAAGDDLTGDRDVVTQVDEILPRLQRLFADLGERDHGLDARAVAGLQRREAQLAGVAAEHDAAGDRRRHAGLGTRLEVGVALAELGDRIGDGHRHRVGAARGIRPFRQQPLTLGEADGLLFDDLRSVVDRRVGGRGVCHGSGLLGSDVQVYRGLPRRPQSRREQGRREQARREQGRRGQSPRASGSSPASASARSIVECTRLDR